VPVHRPPANVHQASDYADGNICAQCGVERDSRVLRRYGKERNFWLFSPIRGCLEGLM
jgi:hypothetical protein